MGGLSSAQFAAYARDQIRAADRILAEHTANGSMCCCGRVLPCSVVDAAASRRDHFVQVLARIVARRTIGRFRW